MSDAPAPAPSTVPPRVSRARLITLILIWTLLLGLALVVPWVFGFASVEGPGFTAGMVAALPLYVAQAAWYCFFFCALIAVAVGLVAHIVLARSIVARLVLSAAVILTIVLAVAYYQSIFVPAIYWFW